MQAAIPLLLIALAACSAPTAPADARPSFDPFLDTLQVRTFGYFRDLPNPETGLVPDRWPTPSFSSIAAVGFGLTAYVVAVERGWLARAASYTASMDSRPTHPCPNLGGATLCGDRPSSWP